MVKAIPEHGGIPPHSLVPLLSIVVTSTTPGPLALPIVHEPLWAEPLTQIDVNVGLTIRVPRAALTGLTNAGSERTNMSKPPIGCEPLTKTPTLNVEPTVRGPMIGALLEQFVAVVEVVIQTNPVPVYPAACAEGATCEGMKSDAARRRGSVSIRRLFLSRLYIS
jgi:hypothetical protein